MKDIRSGLIVRAVFTALVAFTLPGRAATPSENPPKQIPEPLKAWENWALWDDKERACPTPYSDAKKHLCFWPSRMGLRVEKAGAQFDMVVTVFSETWVPLPGGAEAWPLEVKANDATVAVLEHHGSPSVRLAAGTFHLTGAYQWASVPQHIPIPREIGILALVIDGQPVEAPVWDTQGFLWLQRNVSNEEADKNSLSTKIYAQLADGIPLWWHMQIELTVSGKSREEQIGNILPAGWKLASVESPVPAIIDDAGKMKAQVRAGRWIVNVDAFRFDNPKEIGFAPDVKPAVGDELVAFAAAADFRTVEITGIPSVDASQTTLPQPWREFPVYRWNTSTPFLLEERMRGMGEQKPEGLRITRELWLDENGKELTFRDRIAGRSQEIWRLDAAAGQDLGSVRSGGQGQLITRSAQNGAPGVEIRTRDLDLEATGRMARAAEMPATGWRSDADALSTTLNLPPGWRLFALFGADWVQGDWLTAWTLLDLFVLLVFSLAVFRLWGIGPAVLAFVGFGLSYHEPGAPRYLWLILLVPLALQRVVPAGWGRRTVGALKWIAIVAFLLVLVPFVARQVQQALYPQLEVLGEEPGSPFIQGLAPASASNYAGAPEQTAVPGAAPPKPQAPNNADATRGGASARSLPVPGLEAPAFRRKSAGRTENLDFDAKAHIQTGPGVPEWTWRAVSFGWNGPVSAAQQVKPVLISLTLERTLTILRVALLLLLVAIMLGVKRFGGPAVRASGKVAAILVFALTLANASAQTPIPDQSTLDKLRERLLETTDAYPNAAEIPSVTLKLSEHKVVMEAEVHTAIRTAVPMPGRVPAWSPLTVLIDDQPEVALRRDDGYLWLLVEAGVHHVHIEGSLANVTDWEWTFVLKPRQVKIEAPEWTYTGVKPDGIPEAQVLFTRKEKAAAGQSSYDRQNVEAIAMVDRHVELGLIWQVHTVVTRLSPIGKAAFLRIPLLPGETVLSDAVVKDGVIQVPLGAQDQIFSWDSTLEVTKQLKLATRAEDTWVERWYLVASPIWDVALSGLAPTFEAASPELVPVWHPWPGESAEFAVSRPEAIAGATITVSRGSLDMNLGKRQRTSQLELSLRCSLGEDFLVELPADAEVTSLALDSKPIPVRKVAGKFIVPVHTGEQTVSIAWKRALALGTHAAIDEVRLPMESANVSTVLTVPDNRWVLWAYGPQRGPAVRFWGILICSLLAAAALGRVARSPLRTVEWMLLVIGLTQIPLLAALVVVGWLFFLAWRGSENFQSLGNWRYNLLQVLLILLTIAALGILLSAVGEGLLGRPEMFIVGNGSTHTELRWFQARSETLLPRGGCVSISIWWYRFFMLLWALWLASALIRWLRRGWQSFSAGGIFHRKPKTESTPPPLPVKP